MDKFEEVSKDIIDAISKIKYEDKEKQLILYNLRYNISFLKMNKENYEKGIKKLLKK